MLENYKNPKIDLFYSFVSQRMSLPRLKFFWEWKAASPFWPADDAAISMFGLGEIDATKLGLTRELADEIEATAAWHDSVLNWDYPPDPGPWRQEECDRFNSNSKILFERCQRLLAERFDILYSHQEEKEDPDLDAYLAAPSSFRRKG